MTAEETVNVCWEDWEEVFVLRLPLLFFEIFFDLFLRYKLYALRRKQRVFWGGTEWLLAPSSVLLAGGEKG